MNHYDFQERLLFSLTTANGRAWEEIIQDTFPEIISVKKTDTKRDKTGIDYIGTLRRGADINFDLKLREKGCSRFWKQGEEELALEKWSVIPSLGRAGKVGWTLDESKATHYTIHAFDALDSARVFILPFQLLRKVFLSNIRDWYLMYERAQQNSGTWQSECLFVPISVILDAIREASEMRLTTRKVL